MPTKKQLLLRRMNTKAQDLLLPDEDLRLVLNAEYDSDLGAVRKVAGYEQVGDQMSAIAATVIDTDAEWDSGTHTNTEAADNTLQLQGGTITQSLHNDSQDVHGDNWVAQSFKATNNSLDKMAVFIDKVLGSALELYDDFNDDTKDTDKFTYTGTVTETSNEMRLRGDGGSASTNGKTDGDPVLGGKWFQSHSGGGSGDSFYCEITDGTNFIRIFHLLDVDDLEVRPSGIYGTAKTRVNASGGSIEIKEVGSDIKITLNGVAWRTIPNVSIADNSYWRSVTAGATSSDYMNVDNLHFYQDATDLTDLDVRIETDSSGPSGSLLSNGTATIDDADVGESVDLVEGDFSTNPAPVVDTTYWLVLKQTGGDANNKYRVYKQNSNVYADGKVMVSTDGGSSWAEDGDAPSDMAFTLYLGYATSGNWISGNQTLASGQTLSQLVINTKDLSTDERIDRIDITNTSNASQSNYTTVINSGSQTILRAADFSSGFGFTNGNTFRVKLTLSSAGALTPGITSLSIDVPEKSILELSPFYQGQAGTKNLMAAIAGTIKRLISGVWTDVKTNLTSGLAAGSTTFRASKKTAEVSDTASGGDLTTLEDSSINASINQYQGYFLKITGGTGVGQARVIQSNTGTSTSTSSSSSTSTTTSTTTTTTTSTSTSTTTTTT